MRRIAEMGIVVLTLSGCSLAGPPGGWQMSSAAQLPPATPSNWAPRTSQTAADPSPSSPNTMPQASTMLSPPAGPPLPPPPPSGVAQGAYQVPGVGAIQQTNYTPNVPGQLPVNLSDPATQTLMNATATESKPEELPQSPPEVDVPSAGVDRSVGVTPALRIVNSTRFTLGYELRDLGTNGLANLELWSTTDTRTWTRLPSARFEAHACTVNVAAEGTYGFSVVTHDGQRPRAGESPQVWVTVATSKPIVQLQGIDLSLMTRPPALVIRWLARDRNFGPRPVSITYAEKAEGPWITLVANIANTGRYECPIPVGLPHNLFIRIEAIDMAGNVGFAQTAQSVHIESGIEAPRTALLPAPPGGEFISPVSILGVEPTGN